MTTYRSVFSGQEIDEAIAAMKSSTGMIISNNFSGGTTESASAELAKILNDRLVQIETPSTLRNLLATVPDSNIFTNADLTALTYMKPNFRGLFTSFPDRDTKLASEYTHYVGNEICIVLDNGTGNSEFDVWDAVNAKWKRIKLFGVGEFDPVTTNAETPIPLFSFKTASYNTMKVMVSVSSADRSQIHVQEIVVTSNGSDTFLSVYGEVGNAQLFTSSVTLASGVVTLDITPTIIGVQIAAKQVALI